jgi:hypothetical protein
MALAVLVARRSIGVILGLTEPEQKPSRAAPMRHQRPLHRRRRQH